MATYKLLEMVTLTPAVKRYEELRRDILAVLANLTEFAESLPEPENNQLPLHYGHIGPLEDLRERLREATVCADTYSKA